MKLRSAPFSWYETDLHRLIREAVQRGEWAPIRQRTNPRPPPIPSKEWKFWTHHLNEKVLELLRPPPRGPRENFEERLSLQKQDEERPHR